MNEAEHELAEHVVDPRRTPSTKACRVLTCVSSLALSEIFSVLVAVAPLAGEVIRACGGVVSLLATVTLTMAEAPAFPAASNAFACSECAPDAIAEVSQAKENGVELTADEREFIRESAGVILSEGDTGFVYAAYYDNEKQLDLAWKHLEWEDEQASKAGTGQQQLDSYGYIGDD